MHVVWHALLLFMIESLAMGNADTVDIVQTKLHGKPASASSDFDVYVTKFSRTYQPGSDEYMMRRKVFQRRVEAVNAHNSQPNRIWTAGLNHLTDNTDAEIKARMGYRGYGGRSAASAPHSAMLQVDQHNGAKHDYYDDYYNDYYDADDQGVRQQQHYDYDGVDEPEYSAALSHNVITERRHLSNEVDWTNLTSLQRSRDQGDCGSCWAVATAAMLEARYEIANDRFRSVSVQEIVDCTPNPKECGGKGGCDGATAELGLQYIKDHGVATEEDTPYEAETGACELVAHGFVLANKEKQARRVVSGFTDFNTLPSNKAKPLMDAVLHGPVVVAVAASGWMVYENGIYDACQDGDSSDWEVDHAVVMVGYGQENDVAYWKIKNSWGEHWGEKSYMRLLRSSTPEEDDKLCGTDTDPSAGIECKPYPDQVTTCGMCGILYDATAATFESEKTL